MAYEFKAIRRVEFSDTDMAGIMHFSNFFRFMETAEHGFFRSIGFSIVKCDEGHTTTEGDAVSTGAYPSRIGWPRVHAHCDFKSPLRFEDEVEIQLLVCEKRSKSISYIFKFRKLNAPEPVDVARGKLTVVCVHHEPGGKMSACKIPAHIGEKIQVAPAELLE